MYLGWGGYSGGRSIYEEIGKVFELLGHAKKLNYLGICN